MKLKMLVYGDPGVGKTVFAASADKAILLDVEGGVLSITDRIASKKIIHKRIETYPDLEQALATIREKGSASTIIIDSLTEVQKKLNDYIVGAHPEIRRPYSDGLTQSDWGYSTERMRRLVRMVRDMDFNVVFTALAVESKDSMTGAITMMPALSPKLAIDVCGYVDVVGYLFVDQNEEGEPIRKMLFQPTGQHIAKDRSSKLGRIMESPTFKDVHNAIFPQGGKS